MAALIAQSRPPLLMLNQQPLAIRAAAPLVRSAWRLQSIGIAVQDRSDAVQEEDAGQAPSERPGLALNTYHVMDVLEGLRALPDCSVDCVVTSSPYNKRGLLRSVTGLQHAPKGNYPGTWHKRIHYDTCSDDLDEDEYQEQMTEVLNELHRVLKEDGTVWLNHKARRAGFKEHMPTDFIQKSKLNLYGHVVWNLKRSVNQHVGFLTPVHEYLYQLTKTARPPAFFKHRLPLEFRSSVWTIKPERVKGHPCPFPLQLAENCILASTSNRDSVVLDCYAGSGTTLLAAKKLQRHFIGIDVSAKYRRIFERRCKDDLGEQQPQQQQEEERHPQKTPPQQPSPPQPSQSEPARSSTMRITRGHTARQQSWKRQKR